MKLLPRLLLSFTLLATLAATARATWSIVVVDRSTGEVCVATATCISGFQIAEYVPVIVVGRGAAAAQSYIDSSGLNRVMIRDGLLAGDDPATILADLAAVDSGHQTRQYGIVSLYGDVPVTFTGTGAGAARIGVSGEDGPVRYAIQGNVLAGQAVVTECEQTFLSTEGDLVTRVMTAMETARAWGGDGRCSCNGPLPTSCGCPPPNFTHSAYTACIMVARIGDLDGTCNSNGCAEGTYFLSERLIGGPATQHDPIVRLARRVAYWRQLRRGIPDHLLTEVESQATRLPADGITATEVTIRLIDIDGTPVSVGGQQIVLTDVSTGSPATVSGVVDHGNGTHSFMVTSTTTPGTARYEMEVWQGWDLTRLYPDLEIEVDPAAELHVGHDVVSAFDGADVPFVIDFGPPRASHPYLLLISSMGTEPGTPYLGFTIPLNSGRLLTWSMRAPTAPFWPGLNGILDAQGRANSVLHAAPGLLAPYIGGRLDFSVLLPDYATEAVGFDVLP